MVPSQSENKMTAPSNKKLTQTEKDSIEKAIEDADIRAVHPDKLEGYAEHLVNQLKNKQ